MATNPSDERTLVERQAVDDPRQLEKTAMLDQSLVNSIDRGAGAKSKGLRVAIALVIAMIVGLGVYLLLR